MTGIVLLLCVCADVLCAACLHHLGVGALASAWALLQGHVGEGSLAVGPHRVEDRSLEVKAVPV